jgi:hypothetical protein
VPPRLPGELEEEVTIEQMLARRLMEQVDGLVLISPRMPDAKISEISEAKPAVVVN